MFIKGDRVVEIKTGWTGTVEFVYEDAVCVLFDGHPHGNQTCYLFNGEIRPLTHEYV